MCNKYDNKLAIESVDYKKQQRQRKICVVNFFPKANFIQHLKNAPRKGNEVVIVLKKNKKPYVELINF